MSEPIEGKAEPKYETTVQHKQSKLLISVNTNLSYNARTSENSFLRFKGVSEGKNYSVTYPGHMSHMVNLLLLAFLKYSAYV